MGCLTPCLHLESNGNGEKADRPKDLIALRTLVVRALQGSWVMVFARLVHLLKDACHEIYLDAVSATSEWFSNQLDGRDSQYDS
jgi:hypothetical protein